MTKSEKVISGLIIAAHVGAGALMANLASSAIIEMEKAEEASEYNDFLNAHAMQKLRSNQPQDIIGQQYDIRSFEDPYKILARLSFNSISLHDNGQVCAEFKASSGLGVFLNEKQLKKQRRVCALTNG